MKRTLIPIVTKIIEVLVVGCPYRVPVTRLAAAHATLTNPDPDEKFGKIYPMPK